MGIVRMYDCPCDECGEWHNAWFTPLNNATKKEFISYAKENGWSIKKNVILCHKCSQKNGGE